MDSFGQVRSICGLNCGFIPSKFDWLESIGPHNTFTSKISTFFLILPIYRLMLYSSLCLSIINPTLMAIYMHTLCHWSFLFFEYAIIRPWFSPIFLYNLWKLRTKIVDLILEMREGVARCITVNVVRESLWLLLFRVVREKLLYWKWFSMKRFVHFTLDGWVGGDGGVIEIGVRPHHYKSK